VVGIVQTETPLSIGTAMDPGVTTLERAFQLAKSGECRSIDEIKKTLTAEGYHTAQITGRVLLRQLQGLIPADPKAGLPQKNCAPPRREKTARLDPRR
jgi:hypothetical protein